MPGTHSCFVMQKKLLLVKNNLLAFGCCSHLPAYEIIWFLFADVNYNEVYVYLESFKNKLIWGMQHLLIRKEESLEVAN